MSKTSLKLGKVQLQIMQMLWQHGEATARQITEDLSCTSPIAHSTVQTLLRKLEAKGAVAHEAQDRTFVFRPLYRQADVTESAARDLLSRVFGGSVYSLVSHFLKSEHVPPDELARLRRLIESQSDTEDQP